MSGIVDLYESMFGGASRGAFAVRRVMKSVKDRFGRYTPEANPDPFAYDDEKAQAGKYSKHIQKNIGDVADENVVRFKRRKISDEEKEQTKRLDPEHWGIDPASLQYVQRTNRSYFKVAGQKGWFAFPPIKWKGHDGKIYYGLAHYEKKPTEAAKPDGKGGEHYDSIAFLAKTVPEAALPHHELSVSYTRDRLGLNSPYPDDPNHWQRVNASRMPFKIGQTKMERADGVFPRRPRPRSYETQAQNEARGVNFDAAIPRRGN
jgi:hypothetical protein